MRTQNYTKLDLENFIQEFQNIRILMVQYKGLYPTMEATMLFITKAKYNFGTKRPEAERFERGLGLEKDSSNAQTIHQRQAPH